MARQRLERSGVAGMNPEIKKQWVADLRSGKFPQTDGYLRYGDAFCCLGVLCDQAAKAGVVSEERAADDDYYYYSNVVGELPDAVKEWAGLDSTTPAVDVRLYDEDDALDFVDLATLNDDYGFNFGRIADLIESQL